MVDLDPMQRFGESSKDNLVYTAGEMSYRLGQITDHVLSIADPGRRGKPPIKPSDRLKAEHLEPRSSIQYKLNDSIVSSANAKFWRHRQGEILRLSNELEIPINVTLTDQNIFQFWQVDPFPGTWRDIHNYYGAISANLGGIISNLNDEEVNLNNFLDAYIWNRVMQFALLNGIYLRPRLDLEYDGRSTVLDNSPN